uniref:Pentraxin family member n=1 Tax=Myripristis murdjan TaxID=586833 RepID=A0A667WVJ0_9TELE
RFVCASIFLLTVICNVDSMLFFPSASVENYVTFSLSFPNLPELSVCVWLRVEDKHVGTLLSYATDDSDNQLVLYGRSASDPVYRRLPAASLLDGHWHHLCVLWSSIQGRFWHYTDRRLTSSGSNFQKGWEVPGGGSVVLGQEQDTVGGGFDPVEGFAGRMAGFRVWDRVLSPLEVEGVADGRGVPRGVVLSMEDIKEVHGEVKQVACECLEHCV